MPSSTSGPFQGTASGASGHASGAPRSRYIVRALAEGGGALRAFIDSLGAQPAIRLVDTIGPSAGPHTVVIETDALTAEQLRQRNQHQLTIEPDQPLSLFD